MATDDRPPLTPRELALRLDITMKRVRHVRANGLTDHNYIRDWIEAITGSDPGRHPQAPAA